MVFAKRTTTTVKRTHRRQKVEIISRAVARNSRGTTLHRKLYRVCNDAKNHAGWHRNPFDRFVVVVEPQGDSVVGSTSENEQKYQGRRKGHFFRLPQERFVGQNESIARHHCEESAREVVTNRIHKCPCEGKGGLDGQEDRLFIGWQLLHQRL